jgi:hypothetical protein
MGEAILLEMDKPSRLVKELGRIASGQRKVLSTCCVDDCLNEVEVIQSFEAELNSLKTGSAFYPCSFHKADSRS